MGQMGLCSCGNPAGTPFNVCNILAPWSEHLGKSDATSASLSAELRGLDGHSRCGLGPFRVAGGTTASRSAAIFVYINVSVYIYIYISKRKG